MIRFNRPCPGGSEPSKFQCAGARHGEAAAQNASKPGGTVSDVWGWFAYLLGGDLPDCIRATLDQPISGRQTLAAVPEDGVVSGGKSVGSNNSGAFMNQPHHFSEFASEQSPNSLK
jgi:hypothetical protein